MPSSMIFVSLVVLWLLILVPAVARHRQEVARPTVAALSGRVLERPRQQRGREPEVDVMDEVDQPRQVATRTDRDVHVPAARSEARWRAAEQASATAVDDAGPDDTGPDGGRDDSYDEWDDTADDAAVDAAVDDAVDDDRGWERPPPRYRPGRGGFDPQAAELTAQARYALRQRVVLGLLITALVTGVIAAAAVPELWWAHAAADLCLVGYLVYLRRQVRMEESIRERRAARMAGTRRRPAAEDPELDGWARRGREVTRAEGDETDEYDGDLDGDHPADELLGEQPERVRGVGEPLRATPAATSAAVAAAGAPPAGAEAVRADPIEGEPALPRLQPAPAPALPAGTALVEVDEDDPELHDLDGPARPDYRRAAGE